MADAAILTACRDVIAVVRHLSQRHHCRRVVELPVSSFHQNIGRGEMSSDWPKTALARSGDLSDLVETNSPRIRLTSQFGPSW